MIENNKCPFLHTSIKNAEIIILLENGRVENLISEFYFRILMFYIQSFYIFELKPLLNGLLTFKR